MKKCNGLPTAFLAVPANRARPQVLSGDACSPATVRSHMAPTAEWSHPAALKLEANTTQAIVFDDRTRRANRLRDSVFLPIWGDSTVGLPNILLRSSLWSASDLTNGRRENAQVAVLSGVPTVLHSGPLLRQYDRRVFAACLDYYGEDRPLSPGGNAPWIQTSFFEMAQSMGLAYTRNSHEAIRSSLLRLAESSLNVVNWHLKLPNLSFLEVVLVPDVGSRPVTAMMGRDQIVFRVLEHVAALYGPNTWTAVPKAALEMKGLRGWLAGFYATFSESNTFPFTTLQKLSGLTCRPNDFRARVCKVLADQQGPETPDEMRVGRYELSLDRKSISVYMSRWSA